MLPRKSACRSPSKLSIHRYAREHWRPDCAARNVCNGFRGCRDIASISVALNAGLLVGCDESPFAVMMYGFEYRLASIPVHAIFVTVAAWVCTHVSAKANRQALTTFFGTARVWHSDYAFERFAALEGQCAAGCLKPPGQTITIDEGAGGCTLSAKRFKPARIAITKNAVAMIEQHRRNNQFTALDLAPYRVTCPGRGFGARMPRSARKEVNSRRAAILAAHLPPMLRPVFGAIDFRISSSTRASIRS